MTTSRPSFLELHPVEALLVLLWLSAAALLRLLAQPPRPLRRPVPVPYSTAPAAMAERVAAGKALDQLSAAPAPGIAPGPSVTQLRIMAFDRGLRTAGGRPLHKARRADLLAALGL